VFISLVRRKPTSRQTATATDEIREQADFSLQPPAGSLIFMSETLDALIGQAVVLDTGENTIFLGRLVSHHSDGFWLEGADVHHQDEGHASREQYIAESARDGVRANRQRVFVFRSSVISISALADIIRE
jgi:hypothetical protein